MKKRISEQKYLFVYLLITCFIEYYSWISKIYFNNFINGIYYNFYFLICLIFFYFFYKIVLVKRHQYIILMFFICSLFYILIFTKFYHLNFDYGTGVVFSIFCIITSLLWYYQKLNIFDNKNILDDPYFWITSAILFWSVFFIFRSVPMFFLKKNDPEFLKLLKTIQYCVNILMYIMFYIAILKFENNERKSIT